MKKHYLVLTFMCLVFSGAFAQHEHNGLACGSDFVNNQYFQNNPEASAKRDAFDARLSQLAKMGKKFGATGTQQIYEIPIVVHIIHDGEAIGVGSNKTDQQIIDWVNYTNAVYAGTAAGVVGESNGGTVIPIKLVLAKRGPDCNATTGIVRANGSVLSGYSQYGLGSGSAFGATEADVRNLSRWNPEVYYNVYLVKTITGNIGNTPLEIGGYAYFPGSSNQIYGTFMRASTGQVGDTTFAHEMAHSLGIYHTFEGADSLGDTCPPTEADCYLEGDRICDTERIKSMASTYPIPSNSDINPCTTVNYSNTQFNIMSYGSTNDRFTPEQTDRAVAQLLYYRSGLINSLGATAPDGMPAIAMTASSCSPTVQSYTTSYSIGPTKVSFGTINVYSQASILNTPNYVDFSTSCLFHGSGKIHGYNATTLSVSIGGSNVQNIRAYIDWNNDGIFDEASETVIGANEGSNINPGNATATINISVTPPLYAVKDVALRLRVIGESFTTTITPCITPQYGQVEDYAVIVEEFTGGCSGISSSISGVVSPETGIVGSQYNLSATGVMGIAGIQFQWQKSTTGTDSWIDIPSATSNYSTITAAGAVGSITYHRLKVTCVDTQVISFSDVVPYEIVFDYCAAAGDNANFERIGNVTFAGINKSSTSTSGYENFTSVVGNVQPGGVYSFISTTDGSSYNNDKMLVWIDFNNNGTFENPGELVLQDSGMSPWNGNITIPSNASSGNRRMRIKLFENINGANSTPCGNSGYGQVEDYTINIANLGCSGISENISASISATTGNLGTTYTLSATGVLGVDGIQYQWQKSTTGTSNWQNITNATTVTVTQTAAGDSGSITYYRLIVTCSDTQITSFSTIVSYQVAFSYCAASAASAQYEKIGNVTFAGINNSSTAVIGYQDLTSVIGSVQTGESYNFSSTSAESYSSDQMLVWIDFNNNGSFENPGELVLQDSGLSPWDGSIVIPSNAPLGSKRMRIRLHDTADGPNATPCGNSNFGQVKDYTVTISSGETIWDGTNWSKGVPNQNIKALITGALTMDTNLVANELKVASTGAIIIPSEITFTVNGKVTNEGDAIDFVVENGGNLIQQTGVANTGAITVKRNSNQMVRNDNAMWSSPVASQSLRNFSTETLYNRFWTYNEGTNLFNSIFANNTADANFATGLGYSIRVRNTLAQGQNTIHEGIFTGTPFNGNLNVAVVNTATGAEDKGYNSIGNPYPSSIKADGINGFLAQNPNVEALYFWTHQFPVLPQGGYAASNYASYTSLNSDLLGSIAVGQGFIVKTSTSGNVLFNNGMRSSITSTVYNVGNNTSLEKHRLTLKLSDETQMLSKTLIGYMSGATNGFDTQIDGKLIDHTNTTLYNVMNNEKYAVQGRALPFETSDVVSLGFKITVLGQYSIAIDSKDGLFNQGQSVYLKDNQLNLTHNLSQSPYIFEAVAGEFNNRFEVQYINSTLGIGDFASNNVVVYQSERNIVVNSPNENLKSVVIHDILGRILYQNNAVNDTNLKINGASFGNQVLVLQVETISGAIITRKVINK